MDESTVSNTYISITLLWLGKPNETHLGKISLILDIKRHKRFTSINFIPIIRPLQVETRLIRL